MRAWFHRACFAAALASLSLFPRVAVPQTSDVDLALVLAVDCSFSVDAVEFRLQMEGLGLALQDAEVFKAIQSGPKQRIAILVLQWSDTDNQRIVLPWTVLNTEANVKAAGMELQTMPRRLAEGGTSITQALAFAFTQFESAPPATRKTIDLSTDGRNNIGPSLPPVRNLIVSSGITINALVIVNEFPELDVYAERHIAAGNGHFVMKAMSYDDYYRAILQKLVREINGPGTT
jgi:hypothetical protein